MPTWGTARCVNTRRSPRSGARWCLCRARTTAILPVLSGTSTDSKRSARFGPAGRAGACAGPPQPDRAAPFPRPPTSRRHPPRCQLARAAEPSPSPPDDAAREAGRHGHDQARGRGPRVPAAGGGGDRFRAPRRCGPEWSTGPVRVVLGSAWGSVMGHARDRRRARRPARAGARDMGCATIACWFEDSLG